jgi:hypothetical protein
VFKSHLDRAAWLHALKLEENFSIPRRIDFVEAQERGAANKVGDVVCDLGVRQHFLGASARPDRRDSTDPAMIRGARPWAAGPVQCSELLISTIQLLIIESEPSLGPAA